MKPKLITVDGKAFGWKRDSLDTRDFHFRRIEGPRHLPATVDLAARLCAAYGSAYVRQLRAAWRDGLSAVHSDNGRC
jgi:hypothetical protein